MKAEFKTFKPNDVLIAKYIDYYYLDIKPDNKVYSFECFPHYNTTISLYKSHIRLDNGHMQMQPGAKPFQIYTPIRQQVLQVTQLGKVYRIVIVFHPLGIQQFYTNLNFANYITEFNFLDQQELQQIFSTTTSQTLTNLLDSFFKKRYKRFENLILEQAIALTLKDTQNHTVAQIADSLGISRQHLNRMFQSHMGLSVKKFQNIVLFRKTLAAKLLGNPGSSFTELAHDFDFSDQAHLNKIYNTFTANSPKTFFDKGTSLGQEDTFWHLKW